MRRMPLAGRSKSLMLAGLALVACGVALALEPIPQPPEYNGFADSRPILGIPNALNVLSNLPFIVIGALGLTHLFSRRSAATFRESWERWPYAVALGSVFTVGWASFFYHWKPDDASLFWDRLPMTTLFTSMLGIAVIERMSAKWGRRAFVPWVALGVWTLVYGQTRNDFRFYGVLQGMTMVGLPLVLVLFAPRYTRGFDLWIAVALYGAAKACEALDEPIFRLLQGAASGHTLKHLLGAAAAWKIVSMLRGRVPLAHPNPASARLETSAARGAP